VKKIIKKYFEELAKNLSDVAVTNSENEKIDFNQAILDAINLIKQCLDSNKKVIFIGNGASAAISSHMAADFLKNGRVRAITFNDSPLLTCVSNDCGYQYVFEKPIEIFADEDDILVAISSSGSSINILNGAKKAIEKKCRVITLSGFKSDNLLRKLGNINFYVPSAHYGFVEVVHHSICHCILDILIESKNG
jgi:D-sedoheptulose 7-phosphate isomerase